MKKFIFAASIFPFTFLVGILLAFILLPLFQSSKSEIKAEKIRHADVELKAALSQTQGKDYYFHDFAFLNDRDFIAVDYFNGVLTSNDSGITWQKLSPSVMHGRIFSIDFIDSMNGWAAGDVLVSTRDGGKTWQKIKLPGLSIQDAVVDFLDEQIGYVACQVSYYYADTGHGEMAPHYDGITIFKTTDGGKTWRKVHTDNKNFYVYQVTVLDENVALIVFHGESILRTEDGGKTWEIVFKISSGCSGLSFAPDGTGWLVGHNGYFLNSTDKGKTWIVPVNIPSTFARHNWWSIDFTKEGIGVAVSDDAALAFTNDGGQTWIDANVSKYGSYMKVRLYGNTGVILGPKNIFKISYPD